MSSPGGSGGGFEYTDDSVVARLSFDVPPQAFTDATQLAQAMGAVATQQEYLARSTGTWLDYMQQVPQIMERASQSYREAITQMERMAYIQNEMGGGGGNVGPTATAGPQGGYSTAAPQGYINPFQGQMFGMGVTPDLQTVQQQMAGMSGQDPRLFANMMAARGQAINPALLGMVGGAVAGTTGQGGMGGTGGGQGWGNAAPGSQSPQATQTGRDSSAPPDPTQGGQSTKAEPQNVPATPSPDAPPWQQAVAATINGAQQVQNEVRAGGGGGRSAASMLGMASAGMAAAGKWASNNPDAMGGMSGRLAGVAKGAALTGAAAWGLSKYNDVGEEIQKYTQLGAVQGGDAGTGMGYEAQARLLALNPFITTQQARQAMQMALSEGFKGGDFDTVQDYMLSNFKDMGVQFSTSMSLAKSSIYGGESAGEAAAGSSSLLAMMNELARSGGASTPERQEQAVSMMDQLTSQGMDPDSARRSILGAQEGYSENKLLRDKIPGSMQGAMGNQNFLTQVAYQNGITGILPEAIPAALSAKGIDVDEAYNDAAKKYAYMAQQSWPQSQLNAVASFMAMMNQMGAELDYNTAEELYKKVLGIDGAKDPTKQAAEHIGADHPKPFMSQVGDFIGTLAKPFTTGAIPAIGKALSGDFGGAWDELTTNPFASEPDAAQESKDLFAKSGRTPQAPPKTPEEAFKGQAAVRTEGQVTGNVTITVDQSGKVSAPQQIQLSGQQKSANAGYGSAQLNNAPPGDPTYGHAFQGWNGN